MQKTILYTLPVRHAACSFVALICVSARTRQPNAAAKSCIWKWMLGNHYLFTNLSYLDPELVMNVCFDCPKDLDQVDSFKPRENRGHSQPIAWFSWHLPVVFFVWVLFLRHNMERYQPLYKCITKMCWLKPGGSFLAPYDERILDTLQLLNAPLQQLD